MSILIAGGEHDPNLTQLVGACKATDTPFVECRHGRGNSPAFEWNLSTGELLINGQPCQPNGAFIRHDVFEGLNDERTEVATRALAWHQAVNGWLLANPRVKVFNSHHTPVALSKPATLIAAKAAGLRIPKTIITDREATIVQAGSDGLVTKPVAGGDYCYLVSDVLERTEFRAQVSSSPAFLQSRLVAPEIRIYVIGSYDFAFEMKSDSLDYRVNQDADVIPLSTVPKVVHELRTLMSELQMDYGAADFKTDAVTGELVFLELNSSPMFARFDMEANGEVAKAIVAHLVDCCDESKN